MTDIVEKSKERVIWPLHSKGTFVYEAALRTMAAAFAHMDQKQQRMMNSEWCLEPFDRNLYESSRPFVTMDSPLHT